MKIVPMFDQPDENLEHEVRQIPTEKVYVATLKHKKGHSVFKYSPATKKITLVTDEDYVSVETDLKGHVTKKLNMEKGCLYVTALNERNAAKKFIKMIRLILCKKN